MLKVKLSTPSSLVNDFKIVSFETNKIIDMKLNKPKVTICRVKYNL